MGTVKAKMLLIIGASFLLLLSVSAAEELGSCPEDWTDASFVDMGCLYFNNTERLDWMEANEYCQTGLPELNSSLVELKTSEQLAFLQMLLDFDSDFAAGSWIAGTNVGSSGRWFWATTLSPVEDFVWADGEPSRSNNGTVSCLMLATDFDLMGLSIECDRNEYPICQIK